MPSNPLTPDTYMHILIALLSGVFSAGVVYTWVKLSINHLDEKASQIHRDLNAKIDKNFETQQSDLAGIGNKVNRSEERALRRYHNVSLALMYAAPGKKEKKVSDFLREYN